MILYTGRLTDTSRDNEIKRPESTFHSSSQKSMETVRIAGFFEAKTTPVPDFRCGAGARDSEDSISIVVHRLTEQIGAQ